MSIVKLHEWIKSPNSSNQGSYHLLMRFSWWGLGLEFLTSKTTTTTLTITKYLGHIGGTLHPPALKNNTVLGVHVFQPIFLPFMRHLFLLHLFHPDRRWSSCFLSSRYYSGPTISCNTIWVFPKIMQSHKSKFHNWSLKYKQQALLEYHFCKWRNHLLTCTHIIIHNYFLTM